MSLAIEGTENTEGEKLRPTSLRELRELCGRFFCPEAIEDIEGTELKCTGLLLSVSSVSSVADSSISMSLVRFSF